MNYLYDKFFFTDHPSQKQHNVCLMMEDGERFDLTFDHAWNKLNTQLYDNTKLLVHQRWDGHLESGEFFL